MGVFACIGWGFRLVHRSWELVVVQAALSVLGLVLFLLMVGVPMGAALPAGDAGEWHLTDPGSLPAALEDPVRFLAEYASLALVLAARVLLYLTVWLLLWTYALGGSAGVLADVLSSEGHFSFRGFMAHGTRLFGPLMSYLSLVGLVLLAGGLVASGMAAAAALVLGALDPDGLLGRVLAVALAGGFSALALFLLSSASAVGLAPLVLERLRARTALDRGARRLLASPWVLLLVGVLAAAYLVAQGVLAVGAFAIGQVAGDMGVLAYRLAAGAGIGYLGLVGLASILAAWEVANAGSSTPGSGTSARGPAGHALLPPEPSVRE